MPSRTRKASPKSASLARYRAKRDFSKTPEPSGNERSPRARSTGKPKPPTAKSLAFCVQKHLASHLHYDFRLEHKGTLLSWAVPKGPSLNPRDKRLAMRVEDHPFDYRTFEGVIPSGYGAGVVMLWDEGTWTPDPGFENISAALQKGELKFHLQGVKLKGGFVLVRTGRGENRGATATGEREQWLLIKHRDDHAGEIDVATLAPRSIKSDHTFAQILKSDPDLWQSHKGAEMEPEIRKIAEKVAALDEPDEPRAKRTAANTPKSRGQSGSQRRRAKT